MSHIKPKTLNDICELIIDCEHKTAPTQTTGYPSIRTPNIGRGRLLLDNVNCVSEETYREWTYRAIPQADDLILAREAPIGNVAIVPKNLKVCLGQRTVLIRPDKQKTCPEYLLYLLLGNEIQGKILGISNGATVHHLNMKDIRNLELPELPSLAAQQKIGGILSAYDRLIENNTRRIKILEEMAQTLYREWFVNFRFPGYEQVKMVDSELGLIPEDWESENLGRVCHVLSGYAFKSRNWQKTGIPVVKIKNINSDNTINLEEANCVSEEIVSQKLNKYLLRNGDFLVAMTGATAGKVGKLRTKRPILLNQRVAKIEPFNNYKTYIWQVISSEEGQKHFFNLADGAAQPNMSASQIEKVKIILPPSSLCERFHAVANNIYMQIDNFIFRNQNLHCTRDFLLPKLISGEIDVQNLDIETEVTAA